MASHSLSREQIVYSMDGSNPAVLEIDPEDVVTFETYDARTGTVQHDSDLLERPHPRGSNPATGPIHVRGAEPGDALCVEIAAIDLAERGFLGVKAGEGLLGDMAPDFATKIVKVKGDKVIFDDRISFPTRPMVGVIGTAPSGEPVSTAFAGAHGGNMDNRYVAEGSKVYLPVNVDGALLGLGDVHGAMGDGEITFIGLEICAQVQVRVSLLKGLTLRRPRIETSDSWITTGDHTDLGEAARIAAEEMVQLMQEKGGMDFATAYMLMSAVVDVQICQCCQPGDFPTTTRAVIDKALLEF